MIGFDLFFDKINQLPFPNHSKMCANYIKRHFQAKVSNITVNSDILTLVVKLHHEPHLFHYCCRKNAFDTIKMGKSNQISKEKRAQIVILSQAGSSQRKIAQFVGVSKTTVQYTLQRYAETGSYADRKRSGRPKKTTSSDDRRIQVISKRSRMKTVPDIRAEINESLPQPISESTVTRRLHEIGLYGRVAAKKPLLRPQNIRKRLKWAEEHSNWSMDKWKQVLWTDESKFEIFGNKRRAFCRRKPGERYKPDCVKPTVKFGGGSVMVWGCFCYDGVGDLKKIDGIMRKEDYHRILQHNVLPSGTGLIGKGFVFQQDNDPKHTSKLCTTYLKAKERAGALKIMEWPPQSPDANPIELLWEELDREVRKLCPTSETHLWECLKTAWGRLRATTLQKLVERMPRICAAIIKAKGQHIDEKRLD